MSVDASAAREAAAPLREVICPNCGLGGSPGERFCRICGWSLAAPTPFSASPLARPISPPPMMPPVPPPPAAEPRRPASPFRALVVALTVVIGLATALFVFVLGLGAATTRVFNDSDIAYGVIGAVSIIALLVLFVWVARTSWRWLPAALLCLPGALALYIYKERRGAISRRTGKPLPRFPGLAINSTLFGLGIATLIGVGVWVAVTNKSTGPRDVVVALTPPKNALGEFSLSCRCAASGTQRFDVVIADARTDEKVGEAEAAGVYVVLTLKVTNLGDQPAVFPFKGGSTLTDDNGRHFDVIRLVDSGGRVFTQDASGTEEFWYANPSARWTTDSLQPGIPYLIGLVFDVPPGAEGLRVYVGSDESIVLPKLKHAPEGPSV